MLEPGSAVVGWCTSPSIKLTIHSHTHAKGHVYGLWTEIRAPRKPLQRPKKGSESGTKSLQSANHCAAVPLNGSSKSIKALCPEINFKMIIWSRAAPGTSCHQIRSRISNVSLQQCGNTFTCPTLSVQYVWRLEEGLWYKINCHIYHNELYQTPFSLYPAHSCYSTVVVRLVQLLGVCYCYLYLMSACLLLSSCVCGFVEGSIARAQGLLWGWLKSASFWLPNVLWLRKKPTDLHDRKPTVIHLTRPAWERERAACMCVCLQQRMRQHRDF